MIEFLKRRNRYLVYLAAGIALSFALLGDLLLITATAAYTSGTSYTTLLIAVLVFSALLLGLLTKFLVYIAYRISNAIFVRKSGMLYPFPIGFHEFEATVYAFLIPGLFFCGLVYFPVIFLPSMSRILSAIRTLVLWTALALIVRFCLKRYAHDYDKKSLAYSLILIPLILLGISLALTLVEVIR